MSWLMTIQWVLLAGVLPAVLYFLRVCRQGRVQFAYGIILVAGYIWALGQHIENYIYLYDPMESTFWAALCLCYLGMCALGPACVYLSWCYTGRHRLYRSRNWVTPLFGVGVLFYAIVLTNDLHHLYYRRFSLTQRVYGPVFYLFTVFSYACFAYAWIMMQRTRLEGQTSAPTLFMLCYIPPVLANTMVMILQDRALDFTPIAYCLMVAGGFLIIRYYRPVNMVPIAARKLFDDMASPVQVIDPGGNILYQNGARQQADHTYRREDAPQADGHTLRILTDVTEYDSAMRALEENAQALVAAQARLAVQAGRLAQQSVDAAEIAAGERRMAIMDRLGTQLHGRLEEMLTSTQRLAQTPSTQGIADNQALVREALRTVYQIMEELKRRPEDEF